MDLLMRIRTSTFLTLLWIIFLHSNLSFAKDAGFVFDPPVKKDLSDFTVEYVGENSNVSILSFTGNYDKNINGAFNVEARQAVTQEFYRHNPDQYDFLVIFTSFPVDSGDSAAFALSYENDVQGIGLPIFDNSHMMGSERLQTTIDMTEVSGWELNPTNKDFDTTLGALTHEMMHRWGIYVQFEDSNGQVSDLTLGKDGSHWNYFLNSNASLMYGSLWEDLGANEFETKSIRKSLSPLDLYLMGFKESEAVPDFFLIESGNPGNREDIPPLVGTQVEGNRVEISVDDIIAVEGARFPAKSSAQHKFNFKFILLKQPGHQINPNDVGSLVILQREFQKRFVAETRGLGEIVYPATSNNLESNDPDTLTYNDVYNQNVNLIAAESFLINSYEDEEHQWDDKTATQIRDTAMVVKALQYFDQPMLVDSATDWLNSLDTDALNNDELAWLILSQAISFTKKNEIIYQFVDRNNSDEAWGLNADLSSSTYDTALTLKALREAIGPGYKPSTRAIEFILSQLNNDGGVGYVVDGKSSLISSATLLATFYEITGNAELEQNLIDYITNQQHPDGGFGQSHSTAHETALVIQALSQTFNQNHSEIIANAKDKLAAMQSVDGSFEGSVYSTALALQVLIDSQKPNLTVDSADLINTQAVVGEQTSIEYTISNLGENLANNVTLAVIHDQQVIVSELFSMMEPEESFSGRLAIDTSAFLGEEQLELFIDPDNNIIESNEVDNQVSLLLNVEAQSETPELAIDYNSININTDYYDTLPFEFSGSFLVNNLSTSNLENVKVSLMKEADEFDRVELQGVILNIDANQNQLFTFINQFDAADDDLNLVFVIDPENDFEEVNELNNELKIQLKKLTTVDLNITEPQVTLPNQFILGEPADISFEFSNLGTQLSPGFTVTVIEHGPNGDHILFENQIMELVGGQHLSREITWVPTDIGQHSLEFIVDPDNVVSEINENNNSITLPVNVAANTSTNLQISEQSITINPDPGLTGQSLQINALVKNNSNTDSGIYDLNFYHQKLDQPSELITTISGNSNIAAGAQETISVTVNEINLTGEVTFVVEVDPSNTMIEFNENDNVGIKTFVILNKPDGMLSAGGFSLFPSAPVLDEPLTVAVQASNIGEQDLINAEIKLYTKSMTGMTEVESKTINTIEAGRTQSVTFDFIYPNDPNITALVVSIDENDQIDEINESNNQAEVVIENQSGEFYVTESYFSPNGDDIKDQTLIVFNLDDTDDYKIQVLNQFSEVVRSFPIFSGIDFGDVYWDGRNDRQKIVNDGEYVILITGQNTGLQKLTTVWLDTNRTTLNQSLADNDGYITELNCAIDIIGGDDAENAAQYSLDGKYIYLKSYFGINTSEQKGLFALAIDGSSIASIIPPSFSQSNLVESFQVLDNGHILLITSEYLSGDMELWYLNTNSKSFYQLDTQQYTIFNLDITHSDYSIIRVNSNQSDKLKVHHIPNVPAENFSNLFASGSYLSKVKGGWLETNFTDQSTWYRFADLQKPAIHIGNHIRSISADYSRISAVKDGQRIIYAIINQEVTEVNRLEVLESNLYPDNYLGFAPDNQFVLMSNGVIGFYGQNAELKFIVSNPYDINLVQSGLIDSFGSLNSLEVFNELGYFTVSYDQLENPRIEFENIKTHWLSETEFTLSFNARFVAEVDSSLTAGIETTFQFSDNWNFNQRIQYADYPNIEAFDTVYLSDHVPELNSPYYLSADNIVRKAIGFDSVEFNSDIFTQFELKKTYPNSGISRQVKSLLLKNVNPNYETSCKDTGDNGILGVYLPKANLTAFLNLNVTAFGVEINGTLFDANIDKFEVYYSNSANPNVWNLIGVGRGERDKQLLVNWLSPAGGSYQVKLIVYDKAGNSTVVVKPIQLAKGVSSISVPTIAPIYFSPNGDGVLDTVNIQYSSLQAGEVLVKISSEDGQIVKSWEREYAQAGLSEEIEWDGKNNSNVLLEDGKYFIDVDGFKYQVLIDTEAPTTGARFDFNTVSSGNYELQNLRDKFDYYSYIGNFWKVMKILNEELDLGSPLSSLDAQKLIDSQWQDMSEMSFIMNPNTYFENRELYRLKVTDMAGNVGSSEHLKSEQKIYPAELLKLQDSEPNDFPLVYPLWVKDKYLPPRTQVNFITAPKFVDWEVHNKLGLSFQTLTNESIESIKMINRELDELGEQGNIVDERFIDLASMDVVAHYYENHSEPSDEYPEKAFIVHKDSNEIVLHLLELDQSDFPDDHQSIYVEFEISFIGNAQKEYISLIIQFAQAQKPLFKKVPASENFVNELNGEQLNAYHDALSRIDRSSDFTYFWFHMPDKQLGDSTDNNEYLSWIDITEDETNVGLTRYPEIYVSDSTEHISALYQTNLQCDVSYEATWGSRKINLNEKETIELRKNCKFRHFQQFNLNARCDQNTPVNSTVNSLFRGLLQDDPNTDPLTLEIYQWPENQNPILIFSTDISNDDIFLEDGVRKYSKVVSFPTDNLPLGESVYTAKFSYPDNVEDEFFFLLNNQPQAVDFELQEPNENQFYCGVSENDYVSKIPLMLDINVPNPAAIPYALKLTRFVDGVNLDERNNPLFPGSKTTYGRINLAVFEYENNNLLPSVDDLFDTPVVQQLVELNLLNREGFADIQIEAINSSGTSQCKTVRVEYDSLARATVDVFDQVYDYTPNLSGSLDYASVSAEETVDVVVELWQNDQVISEIEAFSLQAGELQSLNWNGLSINGNNLIDGEYEISVTVTDGCGNQLTMSVLVNLDNTAPSFSFITPTDGAAVSSMTEVLFSVDEMNVGLLQLEYEYLDFWTSISFEPYTDTSLNPVQYIAQWSLAELPTGSYPLRLSGQDRAGNEYSTTIQVNYVQSQNLIWQYSLSERFISPNTDGIKDMTEVEIGLNLNADINLSVVDINEALIKSIENQTLNLGAHTFSWDGTDESGQVVEDGSYRIKLQATEVGNPGNSAEMYLTLKSDLTPPLTIIAPDENVIKGMGDLTVVISDENLQDRTVTIQQSVPLGETAEIQASGQSGSVFEIELGALNETSYLINSYALDFAGNIMMQTHEFMVDNTPPALELLSPEKLSFQNGAEPGINFSGTVVDINFAEFRVFISENKTIPEWIELFHESELIDSQFNLQWPITVADGQYLAKVLAVDKAGWETEKIQEFTIDTQPPVIDLSSPLDAELSGQRINFTGTVDDDNLSFYHLSYQLNGANSWTLLHSGVNPIDAAEIFDWSHELQSGLYSFRLYAEDLAELSSELIISTVIDSSPPSTPTYLQVEVLLKKDAILTWQPSTSPDLAGYEIYRNNSQLNDQLVVTTDYQDLDVSEGEYSYWVVAVDNLGNRSDTSNVVDVLIDRTGPSVSIQQPSHLSLVNGLLAVIGSAEDVSDFYVQKLFIRAADQPAPGSLLSESFIPTQSELLAELDTTVLTQDSNYIIRLEGIDVSGNSNVVELTVTVDNIAPSGPLNLTHQVLGSENVKLDWENNLESDLAGYLVYRNDNIISGNGTPDSGKITQTTYLDEGVVDGDHLYFVTAVDEANNVSESSNVVAVNINRRPPDTTIISPIDGHEFDKPISITAESEDVDVAYIEFEFSIDNVAWQPLNQVFNRPFTTILNPQDLSLNFGQVYIRATAQDVGGQTDLSPAQINVEYTDITPPAAVQSIQTLVLADEVHLSWDENVELDLQGYQVLRRQVMPTQQQGFVELNVDLLTTNEYIDTGVTDGVYLYHVVAIDEYENQSNGSTTNEVTVWSLELNQPFSPVLSPANVMLDGHSAVTGEVSISLLNINGTQQLPPEQTQNDGTIEVNPVDLTEGENTFTLYVEDINGHQSKAINRSIEVSPTSAIPLNPQSTVDEMDVNFSWQAPGIDTLGYLPYLDGQPVFEIERKLNEITFNSSSFNTSGNRVLDGDANTYWGPSTDDIRNGQPTFIELHFDQAVWITSSEIGWYASYSIFRPSTYLLQYLTPVGWITQKDFTGDESASVLHVGTVPYLAMAARVWMPLQLNNYDSVRLSEFNIQYQPYTADLNHSATLSDGQFEWQVSAINQYGFESEKTDSEVLSIGDVLPPEPVVISALVENGNNIQLDWTASTSSDVAYYRLFRNTELIVSTTGPEILNHLDQGLVNGDYNYYVIAVDTAGNSSAASNVINLIISQQVLNPPTGLVIEAPPTGAVLSLSWNPHVSPDWVAFKVYRSLFINTGFEEVGMLSDSDFLDIGLSNGITYFYYVTAIDTLGNESQPSATASGIPNDLIAPIQPVITGPTVLNQPITVNSLTTDISGSASAAVEVELFQSGSKISSTYANADYSQVELGLNRYFDNYKFNNSNNRIVYYDSNSGNVSIADPDLFTFTALSGSDLREYFWSQDGSKVYAVSGYGQQTELKSFDLDGNEIATHLSGFNMTFASVSADDNQLFYWGDGLNPVNSSIELGLWLYNFTSDAHQKIEINQPITLFSGAIQWVSGGRVAFNNFPNGIYSPGEVWTYDIQNNTAQMLVESIAARASLKSSIDGTHLYFEVEENNQDAIKRYRLSDAQERLLSITNVDLSMPLVGSDVDLVFVNVGCCDKELMNVETGEILFRAENTGYQSSGSWLKDGSIIVLDNDTLVTLNPPGTFEFNDVELIPGLNEFYVTSMKSNGLASPASESIEITLNTAVLPDLAVEENYVQIVPSEVVIGQAAIVSILVKNNSQVDIEGADLLIELIDPELTSKILFPSPIEINLSAGELFAQNLTINDFNQLGEYALKITADYNQQLLEANEQNNSVVKVIQVIDDLNPDLSLYLNGQTVFPGSDLMGVIRIYNPGLDFNGAVGLKITDIDGFPVGYEENYTLPLIQSGHDWEQSFNWNSSNAFAGSYLAEVTLYNQYQQLIEQQVKAFIISEFADFSLSLESSSAQIISGNGINLSANINYQFGNVSQSGSLVWEVFDDAEQLVWTESESITVMSPGFNGNFENTWVSGQTGNYSARVTLVTALHTESATVPIEVIPTSNQLSLTGLIDDLPAGVALGQSWQSNYNIINNGQIDVNNIAVNLSLWDNELTHQSMQQDQVVSLNVGENTSMTTSWQSNDLILGNYVLVLTVDLSAHGESDSYLLDTQAVQTVDVTGPEIELINPVEQGFYVPNFELRAVISDQYSELESVEINLDGNNEVLLQGEKLNNVYDHWLTELPEGTHQIEVVASDVYSNTSIQTVSFNVDNTPPDIAVTGVTEGGLYNSYVQADVVIADTNLSISQMILDGVVYISGTQITAEGNHVLMINATDLAGNTSTERLSFSLDLTPPMVIISYPLNGSETNQNTTVVSGSTEVNAELALSVGSHTDILNSDYAGNFSFSNVPLISGNNVISLTATDMAGNSGQATEVNINLVDDINVEGLITADSAYPLGQMISTDWQITNLNGFSVNQLAVELNLYQTSNNQLMATDNQNINLNADATFAGSTLIDTQGLSPGDHRLELRVEIAGQWQVLDDHLMALQDRTGPELTVIEPSMNQVSAASVDLLVQATDEFSEVEAVGYKFTDDVNWLPMSRSGTEYMVQLELAHGDHQVTFRALDSFANETISTPIQLTVDTQPPEINILEPTDGLITNQAVTIEFEVTDDHTFNVDAQLNSINAINGQIITAEGEYNLVISGSDEVENQSMVTRDFIIDTTAPIVVVTNPSSDTVNNTGIIDVVGTAEVRNGISISINGIESVINTDSMGQFKLANQVLQPGMNLIVVTATDQAGNVSLPVSRNVEYIQVGSIMGRVWQDEDQDLIIDGDETGLNQITIRLTDSNQVSQEVNSDTEGHYHFSGLVAGSYTIEVRDDELINDWKNTTNNTPALIDVMVGTETIIDFGFYQALPMIEAQASASNIKGRLLILVDPPTAEVDNNQCIGVAGYQLQRFNENTFSAGDTIWAKLYDNQGNLLQTESASHADFVDNGFQPIDQIAETTDFNLLLHPVVNRQLKASVVSSSSATPTVISATYQLVLGLQNNGRSTEWSSQSLSTTCQSYENIGTASGELQLAAVDLYPALDSDDPNGSIFAPHLTVQHLWLENILDDAGWSYQMTSDASEFASAMSEGQYVSYWLMAENVLLPPTVQNNLMMAVDEGAGLLVSSGHDNLSTQFYSSMGVEVSGTHLSATELHLTDSLISDSRVLGISQGEQVMKVSLTDSMSAGTFNGISVNPPDNQAVTLVAGDQGTRVFSAMDWLLQAADGLGLNGYTELIKNVLSYIHPLGLSHELGYARSVQFNMQNMGRPVNGYVEVLMPSMLSLVHSEIPVMINQDGFTFEYDMSENESLVFEFWLKVETTPATLTFEIHLDENPEVFKSLDLTLVAGEQADLEVSLTNCQIGVKPSQELEYQYNIYNSGNKDINAALAFTSFDLGLQNPSWVCTASLGGICDQNNGTGNLSGQNINLPVGASVNYTFNTQVSTSAMTSISSSGYVVLPDDVADVNPNNNSAVDFDSIYQFVFKNSFDCASAGQDSSNNLSVELAKEGQ